MNTNLISPLLCPLVMCTTLFRITVFLLYEMVLNRHCIHSVFRIEMIVAIKVNSSFPTVTIFLFQQCDTSGSKFAKQLYSVASFRSKSQEKVSNHNTLLNYLSQSSLDLEHARVYYPHFEGIRDRPHIKSSDVCISIP